MGDRIQTVKAPGKMTPGQSFWHPRKTARVCSQLNRENAKLKEQLNWKAGAPVEMNQRRAFWHPWKIARRINSLRAENDLLEKQVADQTRQPGAHIANAETPAPSTAIMQESSNPTVSQVVASDQGLTSHEMFAIKMGWREPTANFESMKLLASGDTRLTTFELISLYTGKPICDAIADEKKAQRFVENANSWLPKIDQPTISDTSKIDSLMRAMTSPQDANAVKCKFHKFSPASDQLFVTVATGTTFYEANKISNGKWFMSKDARTGQLWAFELPKIYLGHDGNEIDLAKKVSKEMNISAVMTTPLGNVKEIYAQRIKENDIRGLKQKPGSSIYFLDIDPSAWRTFTMLQANEECTTIFLQYDENGRLIYLEGETQYSPYTMALSYKCLDCYSPRPNWLGLLVAGRHYDKHYANESAVNRPRIEDKFIFSAAHPQSWPIDLIIDTGKIGQG